MASKTSTKPVGIQCEPVLGVRNVYKYSKKGSTTEAYVIDRESLSKSLPIKELQYPGIYFLIGDALDGSDIRNVYVGKAGLHNSKNKDENQAILGRLRQHDTSKTESYRDLWKFAVAITQYSVEKTSGSTAELYGSWGLTEVSNLENIFYHNLPSNCKLNSAEPNLGSDFRDNTDYSGLVTQIKELLVASGSIDFDEGVNLQETGVYDAAEQVEPVEQKEQVGHSEPAKTTVKESAVTTNINPLASVPEYTTPKKTVRQVEDCINPELLNPNTTFIDLACKGGEFLKELYNRLMQAESLIAEFPNEMERSVHILSNQLYGVALSNVSADKARRNLLGYGKNIVTIPNYIGILKASYGTAARRAKQLGLIYEHTDIKDVLKGLFKTESGDPVKFDVVIGNPPYQEATGGGRGASGMALYHYFVDFGTDIADQCAMIIPARWMSDKPNGISDDALIKMRTRTDIAHLIDFGDEQVFDGVNVAGGLCILHIDKSVHNGRIDVAGSIIRDAVYKRIVLKVMSDRNFVSMAQYITSDCFRSGDYMNSGWDGFSILDTDKYNIKYYCSDKDSIFGFGYVSADQIIKGHDVVGQYKVGIRSASPVNSQVISDGFVMEPNSCCSRTFVVLHGADVFSCENDCNNAIKYLKTRFARACIKSIKSTQNASAKAYKFVPMQDFTNSSDIDWSQPISSIDEQLFKKYKLSDDEVAYIRKTIKQNI